MNFQNQNSVGIVMNTDVSFTHPLHRYTKHLSNIKNKELSLSLLSHLKNGRSKRAIQNINRALQTQNENSIPLLQLKNTIQDVTSQNSNRIHTVKEISQRLKMLKKLKSTHAKQIQNRHRRRKIKQTFNSHINTLEQQLKIIDHKKVNRKKKNENSEIPMRFDKIQFGGAGHRIEKVASTTRNIMSHYELKFHTDDYRFDFSENRITAMIHLLNKSIQERVQFYEQEKVKSILEHHHGIKIQERLLCLFEKVDTANEPATAFQVPKDDSKFSKMLQHTFLTSSNIRETLQNSTHIFCEAVAESEMNASGYVFICVLRMLIDVYTYNAPSGSNYISLPKEIENRKSTINIKNDDNECFRYCLYCHFEKNNLAYQYQNRKRENEMNKNIIRNPSRQSNYDKYNYLDFTDIDFPVPLEENIMSKIENQNGISINIYGLDQDENENYHLCPERITKSFSENHIDLLYITDEEKGHYVYISKYDNLCKKPNSKSQVYVCRKCCTVFYQKIKLQEHYQKYDCQSEGIFGINFVTENEKWIQFRNHNNTFSSPFVIYADFECLLNDIHNSENGNYKNHQPCSYAYKICCNEDFAEQKLKQFQISTDVKLYRGDNVITVFLKSLFEERSRILEFLKQNDPMKMTTEDYQKFHSATCCHICEQPFQKTDAKVRDHSHETGKFLGAAHYICNLQRNYNNYKTPVIFHNAQGYDTHFIIHELTSFDKVHKVNLIPKSDERYLSYDFNGLKFIDSFSFLDSSLSNLVKNLRNDNHFDDENFIHLRKHFSNITAEQLKLLLRKGVFPYEYLNCKSKFDEFCLPSQDQFYSSLTQSHITKSEYDHAVQVWKTFEVKTMGEYHDLYLKCDVLQLADVFQHFRQKCISNFKLDPCHYVSTPQLAWDAMLKTTKVKLEIFCEQNQDMHFYVEPHIRGGFSQISHRYAKANNQRCSTYDSSKPTSYIMCEDANSLYAGVMRMKLPLDEYSFVNVNDFNTKEKILQLDDDGYYGYAILISATYPDSLHDLHSDFPVMPENKALTSEMLSEYQKWKMKCLQIPNDNTKKLIADFTKKEKYLVHYRRLKLLLQFGIQLDEVHSVLRFHQECWMKPFIDKNTEGRQNAKDDFEKRLFKLFSNAPYGKTLENVRKRSNIELVVNNEARLLKCISQPNFKRANIFSEKMVAVHRQKKSVTMNKPILVGFSILELSKMVLHDYWYNVLKKEYASKIQLLFTDTDSLCYHVETENIYEDMKVRNTYYDFSEYPPDHPNFDSANKKVPLKFKDVSNGCAIAEFIGIKPKCYSWKYADGNEEQKNKGIQSHNLKHEHFRNCIFGEEEKQSLIVRSIHSTKHEVFTQQLQKVALLNYDNKRFVIDNLNSLPYGHYRIPDIITYQKDYFEFFNKFNF